MKKKGGRQAVFGIIHALRQPAHGPKARVVVVVVVGPPQKTALLPLSCSRLPNSPHRLLPTRVDEAMRLVRRDDVRAPRELFALVDQTCAMCSDFFLQERGVILRNVKTILLRVRRATFR